MIQTKAPYFGEAEPAWDIAQLFPAQGEWTEEDYLTLDTNRLVEYSHGRVEVLAMATQIHQALVLLLCNLLRDFVRLQGLGTVLLAPLPVQLWAGKFREPDVLFMRREHSHRRQKQFWIGADLVMEVISPDDRNRDTVTKRREYAQAGIPEFWLVDPEVRTITVLWLVDGTYSVHGHFGAGEQATSRLLPGFAIDVAALFAEAEE
jgi:Uma2 family endonuclease